MDILAGWPSRETGVDPIIRRAGSDQLIHAPVRADIPRLAPNANKVQTGRMPRTQSARAGRPDNANPLGRGSSTSLTG
jgi:hypothetical protein